MATINNGDVLKRIREDANIQTSVDEVPSKLASSVVPVLISNPKIITNLIRTRVSTGTFFTTSTEKKTFLTGLQIAISSFEQGGAVTGVITATPKGQASLNIGEVKAYTGAGASGSTQNGAISTTFLHPIELEQGTTITATMTASSGSLFIYGYEVG